MDLASRKWTCSHGTVCEVLFASKQVTVLESPSYSPALAPKTFFHQTSSKNCFEGWTRHWLLCIASQGEYFEEDQSDTDKCGK
ncbi:hypothetical protein B7P43_G16806 [Cryptotermes secundus]|uniref:Uncharacterized protein n=1 Tax=Cryptotermes secundus TaxID=105785 RepID=A0A2J7RIW8_9NEOP|nr:hypothetical protein B7P43_G16806 [Cryptotermes secundus]